MFEIHRRTKSNQTFVHLLQSGQTLDLREVEIKVFPVRKKRVRKAKNA